MKQLLTTLRLCAAALAAAVTAARGQTPVLAWDADASAARPAQADVYRGETVALRPAFLERGAPADTNGAAFTLYWQTNGMGAAWWSDPTNAFRWTPARDCGAAAYTLFIRCDTAAGASYRANARLRMLDSPGAAPNMIPLPALAIDFSAVSYLNAPWLTAAAWLSGSNALAGAAQALGPRIDALEGKTADWDAAWQSWLGTNTLRADLTNEAALREAADNTLSTGKLDAAATVGWETGSHASFLTSAPPQSVVSVNGLTGAVEITAAQIGAVPYTGATQTVNLGGNDLVVGNDLHIGDDAFVGGHIEVDGRIELLGGGRYITGASYISGLVPLNSDTWHLSDRAVSGAFLYSNLRFAVDEAIWTADYRLSWWASTNGLASTQQVAAALAPMATTQHVAEVKELHADSFTNLVWKSVYSNGWHWLVAYTNTPGGAE